MSDQSDQFSDTASDMSVPKKRGHKDSDAPNDQGEVGQDQPPPIKTQRLCQYWKFRFTGYKVDQKSLQDLLEEMAVAYGFQEEQGTGKCKVKHFQGTFDVGPSRMRWSQVEKKFQAIALEPLVFPACDYLEKQDCKAADRYVMKEHTRVNGPWFKGVNYEEIAKETVYTINIELAPWQQRIKDEILDMEPNNRHIWWFYEPHGGLGKTTFQKWIYMNYKNVLVVGGKAADMKNAIIESMEAQQKANEPVELPRIIIMNLPKTFNVDYFSPSGTEEVKDMFFYSGKYHGGMVCGRPPKMLIFANCPPPNIEQMAKDRWRIIRLPDGPGDQAELFLDDWRT